MTAPPERPSPRRDPGRYGPAVSLGLNLTAGFVLFTLLGHWIDQRRGGGGGWTLAGIFLGLVYGAYEVWKVVRGIEQRSKEHPTDDND